MVANKKYIKLILCNDIKEYIGNKQSTGCTNVRYQVRMNNSKVPEGNVINLRFSGIFVIPNLFRNLLDHGRTNFRGC